MQSTERVIIHVEENFLRTGSTVDGEVTVVNLPPGKSSYVEQAGEYGPLRHARRISRGR